MKKENETIATKDKRNELVLTTKEELIGLVKEMTLLNISTLVDKMNEIESHLEDKEAIIESTDSKIGSKKIKSNAKSKQTKKKRGRPKSTDASRKSKSKDSSKSNSKSKSKSKSKH